MKQYLEKRGIYITWSQLVMRIIFDLVGFLLALLPAGLTPVSYTHLDVYKRQAGQQPKQKKFETVKDTLRKQISSVLYRATSFEDFSDKLMQQYGIAVKGSRGQLSYLPSGRTRFIRAKHLGDKFDKAAVLVTLQANAERKPKAQFKQDTIGKLVDIQAKLKQGKGIGYERWAKKHNLKAMAQTLILLEEKGLTDEDALDQRIAELDTKFHESLTVVKDLEGRMKANKELRYHVAAYTLSLIHILCAAIRSVFSCGCTPGCSRTKPHWSSLCSTWS